MMMFSVIDAMQFSRQQYVRLMARSDRFSTSSSYLMLLIYWLTVSIAPCTGHGRLIEPPSRASAWRYGFPTPPDYNDHELYCGGFTRQWKRNEGKCGECGDAWDVGQPRPHEYGGEWGEGIIVRRYAIDDEMTVRIELTASHMGYFEFRICPQPDGKQPCLDENLLRLVGGTPSVPAPNDLETRFYPRNGSRIYEIKAQLPKAMKCAQCLLQWRYIAGNNWGICPNGSGAVGCGPQEEFRSCADIAIGVAAPSTTMRPLRPTTWRTMVVTTLRPKTPPSTSTEGARQPTDGGRPSSSPGSGYVALLLFAILFVVALCVAASWYLHRCHGGTIKCWLLSHADGFFWRHNKNVAATPTTMSTTMSTTTIVRSSSSSSSPVTTTTHYPAVEKSGGGAGVVVAPPIPPPRTKRLSRVHNLSADESSVA